MNILSLFVYGQSEEPLALKLKYESVAWRTVIYIYIGLLVFSFFSSKHWAHLLIFTLFSFPHYAAKFAGFP